MQPDMDTINERAALQRLFDAPPPQSPANQALSANLPPEGAGTAFEGEHIPLESASYAKAGPRATVAASIEFRAPEPPAPRVSDGRPDPDDDADLDLTPLEAGFVDALLLSPTLDAHAAYLAVCKRQERPLGDNTYKAARALYRREKVQAELRRRRKAIERAVDAQAVQLEQRIARIALADLRSLYDEDGKVLPPEQWPDDIAAAVKSLTEEEESVTRGRGDNATTSVTVTRKAELLDPAWAIKLLMARRGLTQDPAQGGGFVARFDIQIG